LTAAGLAMAIARLRREIGAGSPLAIVARLRDRLDAAAPVASRAPVTLT
jgi:hypothetical protein